MWLTMALFCPSDHHWHHLCDRRKPHVSELSEHALQPHVDDVPELPGQSQPQWQHGAWFFRGAHVQSIPAPLLLHGPRGGLSESLTSFYPLPFACSLFRFTAESLSSGGCVSVGRAGGVGLVPVGLLCLQDPQQDLAPWQSQHLLGRARGQDIWGAGCPGLGEKWFPLLLHSFSKNLLFWSVPSLLMDYFDLINWGFFSPAAAQSLLMFVFGTARFHSGWSLTRLVITWGQNRMDDK